MIGAVDDYIVNRLGTIKLGDMPLKIYAPRKPLREHEATVIPHIAISRPSIRIDRLGLRPGHQLFVPSEEEMEIEVPEDMGGGVLVGPIKFTVKRYPTPIMALYQLDLRASTKSFIERMTTLMFSAALFPLSHTAQIGEHWIYFDHQEPEVLDELAKPKFWTAFRYWVGPVWIEDPETYEVPSLTEPVLEMGSMDEGVAETTE